MSTGQQNLLDQQAFSPPPTDPEQLPSYLMTEFQKIWNYLLILNEGDFNETHVEPIKVYVGMVRYADGTDWDPSDGEGLYVYKSGGWTFIV